MKIYHGFAADGSYARFHVGLKGIIMVTDKDRIKRFKYGRDFEEGQLNYRHGERKEKRQPAKV